MCYAVSLNVLTIPFPLRNPVLPRLLCDTDYPSVDFITSFHTHFVLRVNGPDCPSFLCSYDTALKQASVLAGAFATALQTPPYASLLSYRVFASKPQDGCECVFYYPTATPSHKLPLIVKLHGGPHNVFNATYNLETLCCIQHG